MEKFIILNKTAPQFVISADLHDVARSAGTDVRLSYLDKQVDVKRAAGLGGPDVTAILDAAKKVWSQGYTNPSITIDLPSGAVEKLVMV